VKSLAKLGKSATETYNLLMEVYGDECLILEFSSGSKDIKREGERSKTIRVPVGFAHQKHANIEKVSEIVRKIVRQILHEKSVLEDGGENPHS
jgi:hypothetical protein